MELFAKVVLSDIEGTTTYISFVEDVLIPFAKNNTNDYLDDTWFEPTTKKIVSELMKLPEYKTFKDEYHVTIEFPTLPNTEKFVEYLMDNDFNSSPLTALQGLVWARGYEEGHLKGHFYNDVVVAFEKWRNDGVDIATFSNFSVMAQRLLFEHSELGSLLTYVRAHFDNEVGDKQSKESYRNIAEQLDVDPNDVVFLTDAVKEARAAKDAGMQVVLVYREGNEQFTTMDGKKYTVIKDFGKLKVMPKTKPQKQ